MTTLQRSSYSFRRQGSSGRIWDKDRVQNQDIHPSEKSRDFNYHPIVSNSNSNSNSYSYSNSGVLNASPSDNSKVPPPSGSRSESKVHHRCGFVSIFGCCVGSRAS
ncbi:hypothetical protein ABFS83_08G018200 [Erythranthe nasuta]